MGPGDFRQQIQFPPTNGFSTNQTAYISTQYPQQQFPAAQFPHQSASYGGYPAQYVEMNSNPAMYNGQVRMPQQFDGPIVPPKAAYQGNPGMQVYAGRGQMHQPFELNRGQSQRSSQNQSFYLMDQHSMMMAQQQMMMHNGIRPGQSPMYHQNPEGRMQVMQEYMADPVAEYYNSQEMGQRGQFVASNRQATQNPKQFQAASPNYQGIAEERAGKQVTEHPVQSRQYHNYAAYHQIPPGQIEAGQIMSYAPNDGQAPIYQVSPIMMHYQAPHKEMHQIEQLHRVQEEQSQQYHPYRAMNYQMQNVSVAQQRNTQKNYPQGYQEGVYDVIQSEYEKEGYSRQTAAQANKQETSKDQRGRKRAKTDSLQVTTLLNADASREEENIKAIAEKSFSQETWTDSRRTKQTGVLWLEEQKASTSDPFFAELASLLKESSVPPRPPIICGRTLNLKDLFLVVRHLGGINAMKSPKYWREAGNMLKFPQTNSNVPSALRRNYVTYLASHEDKLERIIRIQEQQKTNPNHQKPQETWTEQSAPKPLPTLPFPLMLADRPGGILGAAEFEMISQTVNALHKCDIPLKAQGVHRWRYAGLNSDVTRAFAGGMQVLDMVVIQCQLLSGIEAEVNAAINMLLVVSVIPDIIIPLCECEQVLQALSELVDESMPNNFERVNAVLQIARNWSMYESYIQYMQSSDIIKRIITNVVQKAIVPVLKSIDPDYFSIVERIEQASIEQPRYSEESMECAVEILSQVLSLTANMSSCTGRVYQPQDTSTDRTRLVYASAVTDLCIIGMLWSVYWSPIFEEKLRLLVCDSIDFQLISMHVLTNYLIRSELEVEWQHVIQVMDAVDKLYIFERTVNSIVTNSMEQSHHWQIPLYMLRALFIPKGLIAKSINAWIAMKKPATNVAEMMRILCTRQDEEMVFGIIQAMVYEYMEFHDQKLLLARQMPCALLFKLFGSEEQEADYSQVLQIETILDTMKEISAKSNVEIGKRARAMNIIALIDGK